MPLVCVGISHRTAPLAVRELLAVEPARVHAILSGTELRDRSCRLGLSEFALLSTCNRTELYAAAPDPSSRFTVMPTGAEELLARVCQSPSRLNQSHVYSMVSSDALRHLCMVASGLDSMVPGESEVLGQVAEGRRVSLAAGAAGPILDAAFRTAVRAGRRARAETRISRQPASVASEAIRWMRDRFGELSAAHVLVVGTGSIARVAAEILRADGVRHLNVIGRTRESTQQLSAHLGATAMPWHELAAGLERADIVLATTAAPHAVISRELVTEVLLGRDASRRLLLADIAVPRDVEPGVAELPGVEVFDLDQLQSRIGTNLEERCLEAPRVHAIIDEEIAHFETWRSGAALRPVLTSLHHKAEAIRLVEVERAIARMPAVDSEMRARIEALSKSLVAKLLAAPSRRLRAEPDPVRSGEWTDALTALFGLESDRRTNKSREPG